MSKTDYEKMKENLGMLVKVVTWSFLVAILLVGISVGVGKAVTPLLFVVALCLGATMSILDLWVEMIEKYVVDKHAKDKT